MSKDTNDILKWMRLVEDSQEEPEKSEPLETEEPEDLESKKGKGKITREKVIKFFTDNPNPDDDSVHKWADEMGWDHHEVEEVIYNLVTDYVGLIKKEREPDKEEDKD